MPLMCVLFLEELLDYLLSTKSYLHMHLNILHTLVTKCAHCAVPNLDTPPRQSEISEKKLRPKVKPIFYIPFIIGSQAENMNKIPGALWHLPAKYHSQSGHDL